MKRNCVQIIFRVTFRALGKQIAKYPNWFIICPVFLSLFLATGLQRFKKQTMEGFLVNNENSKVHEDKIYLERTFPSKSGNYDPSRAIDKGRFGLIIVTEKREGSILCKDVFNDVYQLDSLIKNITIEWEGTSLKYKDLCAKRGNSCLKNRILSLRKNIEQFQNGRISLTYPLNFSKSYSELESSVMYLGDVQVDKNNYLKSAKALRLSYYLNHKGKRKDTKARLWEDMFIQTLQDVTFKFINVHMYISRSIQKDMDEKPRKALPYLPICFFLMIVFSMITSSLPDWHRSKPWIGMITVFSSGMAIVSGFGLVSYCGVLYFVLSSVVPFLIVGVGMDDTFVMMSVWMKTDTEKSVEDRLSETYSEAGLSITITSLTNFLSFLLGGILSPFDSLKSFCISMCACVVFDYLYQITFVGAMMVLYGRCEERRLHSLTFCPLRNPSEHPKLLHQQPNMIARISRSLFQESLWTEIGKGFTKWYIKIFILIIYSGYLLTSLWGCSKLEEDCETKTLSYYNSYSEKYLDAEYKYFYRYRDRIQIIINTTLDYSNPEVQQVIEKMMNTFESSPLLAGPGLRESWLKSYLMFISHKHISHILKYYNMTKKEDFINILRTKFLTLPRARIFKRDLLFNNNNSDIISSRFLCQTGTITSDTDFRNKVFRFRKVVNEAPYSIVIYHPMFSIFEGLDVIRGNTIYTLCIIALTMAIVCLIFLPDIISALCVSCTVLSVGTGIVGYMALWGIGLNPSSMALLITVSGLSIDYAAHISCAYFFSDDMTSNERIIYAISTIGMPIFQGSVTTILCVAVFVKPTAYSYMLAGKIVFLVCLLAAVHAIIFLPIILSLLHSSYYSVSTCYKRAKKSAGVFIVNK